MSDEATTTTNETPNAGAGQTAEQPNAGQGQQPEQAGQEQAPFATFPTEAAFKQRLNRDTRRQMNAFAKEQGFDDWQHLSDTLGTLRQQASGQGQQAQAAQQPEQGDTTQPAAQPAGLSDADRLRMAIQVSAKLNLPAALVGRLQGDTLEAMEADAQQLVGLMQQPGAPWARPGIPGAPQTEQRATFTRAQLQDPAFVRAHQAEIMQASREGRIVDS